MRKYLLLLLLTLLFVSAVCVPVTASDAESTEETAALPDAAAASGGAKVPVGGSVKLDELGPTIVTEEGELRQIENWDKLSEKEKKVAWTRLRKRNLERIEELRKHSFEVSQHDSTLSDLESDSERSIEDRFISAQHHLAAFQASLSKLKDRGESVPGFDGVEELLEDPSKADRHKLDAAELRRKLKQLQEETEQLKKDKGIRHHEL